MIVQWYVYGIKPFQGCRKFHEQSTCQSCRGHIKAGLSSIHILDSFHTHHPPLSFKIKCPVVPLIIANSYFPNSYLFAAVGMNWSQLIYQIGGPNTALIKTVGQCHYLTTVQSQPMRNHHPWIGHFLSWDLKHSIPRDLIDQSKTQSMRRKRRWKCWGWMIVPVKTTRSGRSARMTR